MKKNRLQQSRMTQASSIKATAGFPFMAPARKSARLSEAAGCLYKGKRNNTPLRPLPALLNSALQTPTGDLTGGPERSGW